MSSSYRLVDCIKHCLILLSIIRMPLYLQSSWCYVYSKLFLLTSFSLPFSELSLVGLALDLVD